jgi:vacuolar-type H+-ATPase subunit E/Vma4
VGLSELVARLERDLDARVAAIEERTRKEAEAFDARAREESRHTLEEALASRRTGRRARLARELADARQRVRLAELCARRALVDRVLARTGELLARADRDDGYRVTVAPQVERALRYVGVRPVVVRCRPSLAALVRSALADQEGVTCEEADMPVGFLVRTRDGSVEIDETLPTLLERSRRRLALRLAALIA